MVICQKCDEGEVIMTRVYRRQKGSGTDRPWWGEVVKSFCPYPLNVKIFYIVCNKAVLFVCFTQIPSPPLGPSKLTNNKLMQLVA